MYFCWGGGSGMLVKSEFPVKPKSARKTKIQMSHRSCKMLFYMIRPGGADRIRQGVVGGKEMTTYPGNNS